MTTPKQRSENVSLTIYKCFHCEGILGASSSAALYVGAAIFEKSITITCGYCGKHTFWKSDKETFTKNNGHSK